MPLQGLSVETYAVLGAQIWQLRNVKEGWRVSGASVHQFGIIEVVGHVQTNLRNLGLPVTERAGAELWDIGLELDSLGEEDTLTADQAQRIERVGIRLWDTFQAETGGKVAYVASDKRYDVTKLLANVGSLMGANTFSRLPAVARFDMEEAGMCVAFERPTAAAFHLMRATEGTLRHFYRCWVRRGRIREPWLWGDVVADLRQKSTPPPSALLDQLDAMRRNFRNPTQHPEKIYDIDEAQDLLASAVDVMNRMTASSRWLNPPA